MKKILIAYTIWFVLVFALLLTHDGLSPNNINHIVILIIFALAALAFSKIKPKKSKIFFVISATILAALVEGSYMIDEPVFKSLKWVGGMTMQHMIGNLLIDWAFTIPVYVLVFLFIWKLIRTYNYSPIQYFFILAIAQALGDSNIFFFINPGLLLFTPFILLNYHTMNFLPFLKVRSQLPEVKNSNTWQKYVYPLIGIPALYFSAGLIIKVIGKSLGLDA